MSKDAFRIAGPAQISFSGGRTSAYMLHRVLLAHDGFLPSNIHVTFANTGKERDETLRFVNECEARWNVKVNWLEWRIDGFQTVSFETASRNGEPFAALIAKKQFLPNWQARFCTQFLKVEPMRAFMASLGYDAYTEVIGLRYDEPYRIAKMVGRNADEQRQCTAPLSKAKITKRDVTAFWAGQPFDLGLSAGEGNCDLCFLKGRSLRLSLIRTKPAMADWWAHQEAKTGGVFDRRDDYAAMKIEVSSQPIFDLPEHEEHDAECGLHCEVSL